MTTDKAEINLHDLRSLSLPSNQQYSQDDLHLQRLGKRPLLNRSFGFMSILGFSCSVLISWEGILVTSLGGLINGGPAGVVWGFLFNWVGMMATFVTIGELVSMALTAGGQYHWVAMMAPKPWKPFLSYLTAWLTTAAWQAMAASTAYLLATLTQGLVVLTNPTYTPKAWHTVLLMWAFMSFAVLLNSSTSRTLANFEGVLLIAHLMGFFCVLIPLVYFAPHADSVNVFAVLLNGGRWSSQALSLCIGLPATAASLLGADGAVHMSEEIQSPATVVPRALIFTMLINGTLAWAMAIAMLFCAGDIEAALEAGQSLFYPFIEIFRGAVNSTAASCVMASVILVMGIASGVSVYASASRMVWSFARDRGMPFSNHLVKLTKRGLPVNAILMTLAITMLLSLIVLGSTVAFNALISLSVAALYSSYLLVTTLLLWRRSTGGISRLAPLNNIMDNADELMWGPWHLREPWGAVNNGISCAYLVFIWFWSFWPPATPVTPETANFSVLAWGAVVIGAVLWYASRARHFFKGPVNEVRFIQH